MGKPRQLSPDDLAAKERASTHRARVTTLREALIKASTDQGEARRLWGRAHDGRGGEVQLRRFFQHLIEAELYDGPEPNWGMLHPHHAGRYGAKVRLV